MKILVTGVPNNLLPFVAQVAIGRRSGDIAECWADPALAEKELGWTAKRGIDEMCADAWNWQQRNPYGYNKPK